MADTGRTPPSRQLGDTAAQVYRWAYDYSVPGAKEDFIPQNHPVTDEEQTGEQKGGTHEYS